MTYTAFSAQGPRIALALSREPLPLAASGILATFGVYQGIEIGRVWMTKTPACFRSPFLIRPGNRNWQCSTGRFSRHSSGRDRLLSPVA